MPEILYIDKYCNDDIINKIIALADYHTVTIELFSKIADTEEVPLNKFYQTLIECGFRIGNENVVTAHEKLHDEDRVIEQLIKLFRVYDCSEAERNLLIQASTIPNIPFLFTQAQRWFGISYRTDINTEDSPTIIQFREKAAELHQLALTT